MTEERACCPRCTRPATGGVYRAIEAARRRPELEPATWEDDIEVLQCKSCDGVWLLEGQLDAIRRTRGNDYSGVDKLAATETHARKAASAASEQPRELDCPICATPLVSSRYRSSHVVVHTCMRCAGSFIDADGLVQLELESELRG